MKFCRIINIFTVTFDKFNAVLLYISNEKKCWNKQNKKIIHSVIKEQRLIKELEGRGENK